jgi:hypothetical protein
MISHKLTDPRFRSNRSKGSCSESWRGLVRAKAPAGQWPAGSRASIVAMRRRKRTMRSPTPFRVMELGPDVLFMFYAGAIAEESQAWRCDDPRRFLGTEITV